MATTGTQLVNIRLPILSSRISLFTTSGLSSSDANSPRDRVSDDGNDDDDSLVESGIDSTEPDEIKPLPVVPSVVASDAGDNEV